MLVIIFLSISFGMGIGWAARALLERANRYLPQGELDSAVIALRLREKRHG